MKQIADNFKKAMAKKLKQSPKLSKNPAPMKMPMSNMAKMVKDTDGDAN